MRNKTEKTNLNTFSCTIHGVQFDSMSAPPTHPSPLAPPPHPSIKLSQVYAMRVHFHPDTGEPGG
jgi:hypothetical protein